MTFLLNLNSLTKQFLQYISSSNSREIDGRTPLVLLTLLLFKLPGLDEPFTLNTLALLPFQLLGDNSQERKSKAGRNSYSSFPISKVFHTWYQILHFLTLALTRQKALVFLARVSQFSFFSYPQLTSVEPSERVFGRYFRSTV